MTTDEMIRDLRTQVQALTADNRAMRAQLEGDIPVATRWLQIKVWRQQRALDALNRRVLGQRLVLRTLEGLGRGLTPEEYRAARDELAGPVRDRTPETVPA